MTKEELLENGLVFELTKTIRLLRSHDYLASKHYWTIENYAEDPKCLSEMLTKQFTWIRKEYNPAKPTEYYNATRYETLDIALNHWNMYSDYIAQQKLKENVERR